MLVHKTAMPAFVIMCMVHLVRQMNLSVTKTVPGIKTKSVEAGGEAVSIKPVGHLSRDSFMRNKVHIRGCNPYRNDAKIAKIGFDQSIKYLFATVGGCKIQSMEIFPQYYC